MEGDLILVQDFPKEKNKGMKFEPHWTRLQTIETINHRGWTAMICKFYLPNIHKIYLDDVQPYHQQTLDLDHPQRQGEGGVTVIPALKIDRSTIVMATIAGVHAVDLYSI